MALLSIPLGFASLHYEQGQPISLANDLQLFTFRWQSGVQLWVAVDNGVMYISKDYIKDNLPEDFFDKNVVIGYQYFARPTKQSSFGYGMTWRENFNDCSYFDKVFFRHDIEASKVVFDMSYRQNRFIPKDKVSKLARKIKLSDEVTREAVKLCLEHYCHDRDMAYMDEVCKKQGWKIREDNTPIAVFEEADLAADWKEWMEFGKADIEARTLPIYPVTTIPLKDLQ